MTKCSQVYNKALTLNVDCRAHDAMNYIVTQMKTIYPAEQFRTSTDDWLFSLYTGNYMRVENNKMIWTLLACLNKHIFLKGNRIVIDFHEPRCPILVYTYVFNILHQRPAPRRADTL